MAPKTKLRKSFIISSRLSRTLKIQYNDQSTELPIARKTPTGSVFLKPFNPPCEEIKNTHKYCHICQRKNDLFWIRVVGRMYDLPEELIRLISAKI